MPVTEVSVANGALILLGADVISSITQDSRSARVINPIFETTRDAVLAAHPWNFAIGRALWAATSTTPTFEYDYEYDIPANVLRVLGIADDITHDVTGDFLWDVENNRKLFCNLSPAYVKFIERVEDAASWSPLFGEAFSAYLAWKISYAITQSNRVREDMRKLYKGIMSEARSMDGMEASPKHLVADVFTGSRRRGGTGWLNQDD